MEEKAQLPKKKETMTTHKKWAQHKVVVTVQRTTKGTVKKDEDGENLVDIAKKDLIKIVQMSKQHVNDSNEQTGNTGIMYYPLTPAQEAAEEKREAKAIADR